MFRILTNKQTATFKIHNKIYKIEVERRVDGKSHIKVQEIFLDKVSVVIQNKYQQLKTIADKEIQIYAAIEQFYPDIIVEEIDEDN
jgi:predicted nucleic acid-binding protein